MRKQLFIILAILLLSSLACTASVGGVDFGLRTIKGSGELITKDYDISDFSKLEFSGIGHVEIALGEQETLSLEAEDNLVEYFEIEVRGDTLHIGLRKNTNLRPTEDINIFLTVVDLDSLSLSGLGDIDVPGFAAKRFDVGISGAGDINIEQLEADELRIEISGLGSLRIEEGRVQNQTIEISGSGNYEARDVQSDLAKVSLSGLGSATLWVDDNLDVEISGAGTVNYSGEPQVKSSISGLGDLEHIER